MDPQETGKRYDAIARWWDSQQPTMSAGIRYVARAVGLCLQRGKALDVGCGSGGRIVDALTRAGFRVFGVDVSAEMLQLARKRHPHASFIHADITQWDPPEHYDLIVAWDSTFHVPHAAQRMVHEKLCAALSPGGVILFTAGGIDGEINGEMQGEDFYYSSLATTTYLEILNDKGCDCILLERDQYPEHHVVLIGKRST